MGCRRKVRDTIFSTLLLVEGGLQSVQINFVTPSCSQDTSLTPTSTHQDFRVIFLVTFIFLGRHSYVHRQIFISTLVEPLLYSSTEDKTRPLHDHSHHTNPKCPESVGVKPCSIKPCLDDLTGFPTSCPCKDFPVFDGTYNSLTYHGPCRTQTRSDDLPHTYLSLPGLNPCLTQSLQVSS